jgi:hypothetical protein
VVAQHDEPVAVTDIEDFQGFSARPVIEVSVGQHAINVQQEQAYATGPSGKLC